MGAALHAPAAARNAEPIREVLARVLPSGLILEIASGTGQHAVHMAHALPDRTWQPSDPDPEARASIAAHLAASGLANLRPPLALDAAADAATWPLAACDAIVCINMLHISPWAATLGLLAGAARLLPPGAPLVTYGPYRIAGVTAPSNLAFDASLRGRDPAWGVRDVVDLAAAAAAAGLRHDETVAMPANNHCLVFRAGPA